MKGNAVVNERERERERERDSNYDTIIKKSRLDIHNAALLLKFYACYVIGLIFHARCLKIG